MKKDEASLFYCYLLEPSRIGNCKKKKITKDGYVNWRWALETFDDHVGGLDSAQNKARKPIVDFKNQLQSVEYVWSMTSVEKEEKYKARLTIGLGLVRFSSFARFIYL